MKVLERPFGELALIELKLYHDDRGFFAETFRREWMDQLGIEEDFVQENHSRSKPGVLRGLHFQMNPPQGKLVSAKRGCIWDVAVDIRRRSPTFGQYFGAELSDANGRMLWVPAGFAHGFCVMGGEEADVTYKVTGYYNPASEAGIRWDDPQIDIRWPVSDPILSSKDAALASLEKMAI